MHIVPWHLLLTKCFGKQTHDLKDFVSVGSSKKLLTSHVFLTIFTLPTHKNPLSFPFFFFFWLKKKKKTDNAPFKDYLCTIQLSHEARGSVGVSFERLQLWSICSLCMKATFPCTMAGVGVWLMQEPSHPAVWETGTYRQLLVSKIQHRFCVCFLLHPVLFTLTTYCTTIYVAQHTAHRY